MGKAKIFGSSGSNIRNGTKKKVFSLDNMKRGSFAKFIAESCAISVTPQTNLPSIAFSAGRKYSVESDTLWKVSATDIMDGSVDGNIHVTVDYAQKDVNDIITSGTISYKFADGGHKTGMYTPGALRTYSYKAVSDNQVAVFFILSGNSNWNDSNRMCRYKVLIFDKSRSTTAPVYTKDIEIASLEMDYSLQSAAMLGYDIYTDTLYIASAYADVGPRNTYYYTVLHKITGCLTGTYTYTKVESTGSTTNYFDAEVITGSYFYEFYPNGYTFVGYGNSVYTINLESLTAETIYNAFYNAIKVSTPVAATQGIFKHNSDNTAYLFANGYLFKFSLLNNTITLINSTLIDTTCLTHPNLEVYCESDMIMCVASNTPARLVSIKLSTAISNVIELSNYPSEIPTYILFAMDISGQMNEMPAVKIICTSNQYILAACDTVVSYDRTFPIVPASINMACVTLSNCIQQALSDINVKE